MPESVALTINGEARTMEVSSADSLLDALRYSLDLTGSKECCAVGECGACTVLLDGRAVNSCLVLAVEAEGRDVVTVEGLENDAGLSPIQEAFLAEGAVQCGFCIPGMVVSASYLLDQNPSPSAGEIDEALAGNLCRCGGYLRIRAAVTRVASERSP